MWDMGGGPSLCHRSALNSPSLGLSGPSALVWSEGQEPDWGAGEFLLEGPLPLPGLEFRGHRPHSPRANTQPLFLGPWERGGEGPRAAPSSILARKAAQQVWSRRPAARGSPAARGPAFSRCLPTCASSNPTDQLCAPGQASALPKPTRKADPGPGA